MTATEISERPDRAVALDMHESGDVTLIPSDHAALGGAPRILVIADAEFGSKIEGWIIGEQEAGSVDQCDRLGSIGRAAVYDCVVLDLGGECVAGDPVAMERLRATYPAAALIVIADTEDAAIAALAGEADEYVIKDALGQRALARALRDAQQRRAARDASCHPIEAIDRVPWPLMGMSTGGDVLSVNKAGVELLGYPDMETLLKTPLSKVAADLDELSRFGELMIRDGSAIGHEVELIRYNGKPIWVSFMGHAEEGVDGAYWLVGAIDVTARRRAEQAALVSKDRHRTLFEQSPVGLWEEDFSALEAWFTDLRLSGVQDFRQHLEQHPEDIARALSLIRVVNVNPAAVAMVGADSKEQLLGPLEPFADGQGDYRDVVIALWEGRTDFETDVTGVTRDGRIVNHTLHMTVTTIDDQLDLSFVIVAVHDTTNRMRLERDLSDAKAQFQHAFEVAPVGIAIYDSNGRRTHVNPAYCDLVGRSASELISTDWRQIAHQDDVSAVERWIADFKKPHSEPKEVDFRMMHSDGTTRWVTALGSAVVDLEGELTCSIIQIVDNGAPQRSRSEFRRPDDKVLSQLPIERGTELEPDA